MAYTIGTGIGAWGLNKTIDWAWDITNFVGDWNRTCRNFNFSCIITFKNGEWQFLSAEAMMCTFGVAKQLCSL